MIPASRRGRSAGEHYRLSFSVGTQGILSIEELGQRLPMGSGFGIKMGMRFYLWAGTRRSPVDGPASWH
jgi:hypothetical protein